MIAQPVHTTPTSKSQAHPSLQQQQQQPQNADGGFQSLLSMTDSSLTDLAQKTGASSTPTPQPANSNKQKKDDPTAIPYVPAPAQPPQPAQALPPGGNKAGDASVIPNNAVMPAADAATAAAAAAAAAGAAAPDDDQADSTTGNSSAFGADELNARIVAGAPIYSSQPGGSLATVPAHLLDAANAHPLPGDQPVGKPGTGAASGKAAADPNALMTPSTANAGAPATTLLPSHQVVTGVGGNADDKSDDDDAAAKQAADASTATTNDPLTPSASLLTQPTTAQNAPAQADAVAHTPAPYVPVGEQVAANIKQSLNADNNELRITLKPASLGTIDVKLNVGQDGRINAVISADRSDTLNMLKQDSSTLQQALKDAGLNADSSSLSFNLNSNAQSFAQNWSQGSGSGHSGGSGSRYGGSGSGDAVTGTDTPAPAQRSHSGALNIEV